ncbi:MAG: hypothetical protein ACOYS2_01530 [Patescibacteria group bacterium]
MPILNFPRTNNFKQTLLVFLGLVVLGFSFLALAQNNSPSRQNVFLDGDQDGISDEEEGAYGTDPRKKDTDNDGYSDGVEIKSGYNPLKPAPGDKLISEKKAFQKTDENQENLTKKLAQEILTLSEKSKESGQAINSDSIQTLIDQTLGQETASSEEDSEETQEEEELSQDELVISPDELKIKKQNYSEYSEEKQKEKKREDMMDYMSGMYYILSSNSPEAITSGKSFSSIIESNTNKMVQAFTSRNSQKIADLKTSGEKIFEQAKEIEVPEEMVDAHISALTFAKSAIQMESYISPNPTDPIKDIQNLSQIEGLLSNIVSFSSQVESKLSEYDIDFSQDLGEKIEKMGVENIFSN